MMATIFILKFNDVSVSSYYGDVMMFSWFD